MTVTVLSQPRIICLLFAVLGLLGCPGSDTEPSPEQSGPLFSGVTLRFAVPEDLSLTEDWAAAVNDWAGENDASVELVPVDTTDGIDAVIEASPSLSLLPNSLVGDAVAAGLASPIPAEALASESLSWNRIPPNVRNALGMLGKEPSLVPVTDATPVIMYRSDLLEAAGKTPPQTWDDYQQLLADLPAWADGLEAVEPWSDGILTTMFLIRAISGAKHPAQYSVELDASTAEPLIATEPFVRALEEMSASKPHLSPDIRSLNVDDCLDRIITGKAAIGIVWSKTKPAEASKASNGLESNLAFAPVPGRSQVFDRDTGAWVAPPNSEINRPSLCGFEGYTVMASETLSDVERLAAWDLWSLLESYQTDGTITALPGQPVANGRPAELFGRASAPLNLGYGQSVATISQQFPLVCELPLSEQSQLRQQLTSAIARTIDDEQPAEESLQQAAGEWTQAITEAEQSEVLNTYRRRLGLTPLAN